MIEIRGLTKRFGDLDVLRGLNLDVARGRVTAIVGPNAAGKTTLIKSIIGLTRPDSGLVTVDGVVVNGDERYRAAIGYMPQIARFPDNMTAGELLRLVRDLRGHGVKGLPRGVIVAPPIDEELVERFQLRTALDKPMRTLSGGSRQKVNAALAFLFAPPLLILDEPTAGLDPVASSVLKDKILGARGQGRTVVITSHVMSELEELADDVAVLIEGVVRFAGPLTDLKRCTRQPSLERAVASVLTRPVAA
ncbi:MAG TPA: ABC transporter ATP-binding protein [Gemmatimonadaceae bacterium]|nr:ABC transporter ATP-binding protein [Gemmatimonadaceae bacterium]